MLNFSKNVYNKAMPTIKNMKIYGFWLHQGAEDLPGLLKDMEQSSRGHRTINHADVRLEDIRRKKGLWLMNFIRSQDGPSPVKYSRKRKSEKIPYGPDQKPADDVVVLYAPKLECVLMQATAHFRATPIQDYLNAEHGGNILALTPIPNYAEFDKYALAKKIKMAHFKLEPRGLTSADCDNNVALTQALGLALNMPDVRVEVKISSTKRGGDLGAVYRDAVDKLKEKTGGEVSTVKVKIENPDRQLEMLNLVDPSMQMDIPLNLEDKWRVFPLEARYDALVQLYQTWKPTLEKYRLR